jgi:hypothetical protein
MSRTATLLFNSDTNRFSRDCLCAMNMKSRDSLHRLSKNSAHSSQSSFMDVSLRSSTNERCSIDFGGLEEIDEIAPWH